MYLRLPWYCVIWLTAKAAIQNRPYGNIGPTVHQRHRCMDIQSPKEITIQRCLFPLLRSTTMAIFNDSLSSSPPARIVSPQASSPNEESVERALRPKSLAEYTGQHRVREQLEIFITAARKRQ